MSWIYPSFSDLQQIRMKLVELFYCWIYPSFSDLQQIIADFCIFPLVGYTLHFQICNRIYSVIHSLLLLDIPFIFRSATEKGMCSPPGCPVGYTLHFQICNRLPIALCYELWVGYTLHFQICNRMGRYSTMAGLSWIYPSFSDLQQNSQVLRRAARVGYTLHFQICNRISLLNPGQSDS